MASLYHISHTRSHPKLFILCCMSTFSFSGIASAASNSLYLYLRGALIIFNPDPFTKDQPGTSKISCNTMTNFMCSNYCLFSGSFICRKCGSVYAHRQSLYNHSFSCGKIAAFKCPFCSKCFTRKHTMHVHIRLYCKIAPALN